MKSFKILAAQSAIALGVIGSAHALTPDLSPGGSLTYQAIAFGPNHIEHTYRFSLSVPSSFSARIASFGFDQLRFSVFNLGGTVGLNYDNVGNSLFDTGPQNLPAGELTAFLVGTSGGPASGYNLTMYALPVPEPSQWLLMGAGLMIVAFIAKRRSTAA